MNDCRKGYIYHFVVMLILFFAEYWPSDSSGYVSCNGFWSVSCCRLCTGSVLDYYLGSGSCTGYWTYPHNRYLTMVSGPSCTSRFTFPPYSLLLILVSVYIWLLLLSSSYDPRYCGSYHLMSIFRTCCAFCSFCFDHLGFWFSFRWVGELPMISTLVLLYIFPFSPLYWWLFI